MSKFNSLKLNNNLLKTLSSLQYVDMSNVQEAAIPLLLANEGLIVKAPTGSGKTLTYLVPILNDLTREIIPQALIIVPTKVLVEQVGQVLKKFKNQGLEFSYSTINEMPEGKIKTQIIVTTPKIATSLPLYAEFKALKRTIIDEGDMVIFGGFEEELAEILDLYRKSRITIFTASIDEHLDSLVKKSIGARRVVDVTEKNVTASHIKHHLVDIRDLALDKALVTFLKVYHPYKAIIFASKKEELDSLAKAMSSNGYKFALIHGDLPKNQQKRAYLQFNRNEVYLMLASDIASRGVDIADVSDVISVNLPKELVYYFHRAGRAGRFNANGDSYVFYRPNDISQVKELIKKGTNFDYYTLKSDSLKQERNIKTINKKNKTNDLLEKQIRKAVAKVKSNKVKPNYKKKVKVAAQRAKERHKNKIIRTNLRKKDKNS